MDNPFKIVNTAALAPKNPLDALAGKSKIAAELEHVVTASVTEGIEPVPANETDSRRAMSGVKTMLRQSGYYTEPGSDDSAEERDLKLKAMETASKIKRKLRYVSGNAGGSALKELLASGVSLGKISIDILSSVLREIEAKPDFKTAPGELDAMIDKYMAEYGIPAGEKKDKELLVKSLAAQGLPPTERNMRSLSTVLMKIRELGAQDEDSIAKLLKEEKALTVDNIYLARHTCAKLPEEDKLTPDKWRLLEPEVDRIFERENILKTDRSLNAAWLMLEREIPITAETVDKAVFLRELDRNLDERKLLYQAAGRIKQDRALADVSVYADSLPAKYEHVMADLPFIIARHMEFLLKREPDPAALTVAGCCDSLKQPKTIKKAAVPVSEAVVTEAYNKILDIQRKLTYEAASRLMAKKIDITPMKLDEAISGLNKLAETVDYSKNLRAMNAEVTAANNEVMRELYNRLPDITPTNHVFAALLAKSIPFTVRATHELVFADRQKIDMREGYEKFETVITAKHGDSFAKIREQIEPLLKTTGVKATNDNVKAAGILIKNKLDVTPGNITEIRLIDAKFSAIQDKLHPNIAAAMIKERMNPLDMHVDDVLRFIDGFNDEYGENARDKLAEHIRALDDAKTLTKEERGAMIAVYRALNAISKDDSAGLGLGLKYGGGLTLGDMLADARNFQRYGGESDDMLSRDRNDNIRQMLEDIPRKTLAECELNAILIDKISEKATPGALKNVYSNGGKHLELSEALEFMDDETYDAEFSDGQLTRMRAGLSAATELSVENLGRLAYSQAPLNVANMQAMALLENAGLGRMLDKLAGRLRDAQDEEDEREELEVGIPDGDLTALKDGESVENVLADISARLEDIKENITSRSLLDELILVQNAVMVQRHLCRNEPVTLPVRLSGGIAGLNMYVLDEAAAQGESVDLAVALDTPNLGQVKVFAKRSGESVSLEITAGSPRAEAALKRNIDFLRECLAAAGYGAEEIVFKGAPENKTEEKITIGENPDPPQTAEFEAKV